MKKTSSAVILVWRSWLFNYYLSKVFVNIEHNSNHLSSVTNEVKQIIHATNIQKQIFLWRATQQFPF